MFKKILSIIFALFSLLAVTTAQEVQPVKAKFVLDMGASYGGDELLEIRFTSGDTQEMLAGQGGYIAAGGQLQLASLEQLLLRGTVGIKFTGNASENANIRLTRIPMNLGLSWVFPKDIRLGAGITKHQRVRLKGDGFFDDESLSSSVGPRFELGWKWLAVTYERLEYTDSQNNTFDAGSFGGSVIFTFPNK